MLLPMWTILKLPELHSSYAFFLLTPRISIAELLGDGGQRVFHGAVRLALNEDVAPLMEYPVGDLHFQRVDGAGQVGVDQFRLVHKCLEVGLYRLIDVGQVFLDCPDQVLRAEI